MATFCYLNKSHKVVIKEKATKRNEVGCRKQYPFYGKQTNDLENEMFLSMWNLSIVFKREHTSYFVSGKCTMTTENTRLPVDQWFESACTELKIIGTRKSNCLMLMRASKILWASIILPLITLNSKRPLANKTVGTLTEEQTVPWEDLLSAYFSLGFRTIVWLRNLRKKTNLATIGTFPTLSALTV